MGEGLSESEARYRLSRDGANELARVSRRGSRQLLLDIVAEPMFLLLVACGVVYMSLGDSNEALMLLGFVFVVIGITFVQRRRTENSLDALRSLSSPQATVMRDGQLRKIPSRELVCDDIVWLAEGDFIPADMQLIKASNLAVDESMLTGESVPVNKQEVDELTPPQPLNSAERQVFAGTLVIHGSASGRVVATGERSALGRIGRSLKDMGDEITPVQRQTRRVIKQVAVVGLILASLLVIFEGLLNGNWLRGLLTGLTFAMAVLPEELPVVLTLFLGLGAWRLAHENVLARSIPAVELLGATTVLCVDKTGTLTANRMAVRQLRSDAATYDDTDNINAPLAEELHGLLEFAVLASYRHGFDPMDRAINECGQRLLARTEHLHNDWTLVEDYPLSHALLAMSRVWQSPNQQERMIAAKGAPEAIVDLCHMSKAHHAAIASQVATMAAEGLRVLGVARAKFGAEQLPCNQHDFEFEFLGLVGLQDPLRPDVPQAIADCHAAGIRVVMITGDHPQTAMSIARQAGLKVKGDAVTGAQISSLSDEELKNLIATTHVFCRIAPEQKLRLVQAFRAQGEVVAMTGDGVNDAAALKAAHIGVAMGARGTDVAREAAALVLLRDDFASLVTAVRYGRRVFANLRKAIVFVVAVHAPIVGLSILPVVLGWPMLLMPVHILFLQLIIDPACSIVFEAEPLEEGAMTVPPRSPNARLFDWPVLIRGLLQGIELLAVMLLLYLFARYLSASEETARALMFSALVLSSLGLILANKRWHGRPSLFSKHQWNHAFLWVAGISLVLLACALLISPVSRLFAFATPSPVLLLIALGAVVVNLLWFEISKAILKQTRIAA